MTQELEKTLEDVHAEYKAGRLPRREFVRYLCLSGAAIGLMGGPFGMARKALAAQSIRFDGWGGTVSDAFNKYAFKPFSKATGIKVIDGEFGNADSYLTRVKASYPPGGEYNLAHLSGVFDYKRYVDLGFDTVLDESKIPNLKNVMPAIMEPYRAITNGKLSAVPYDYGLTTIAYNSKYISDYKAKKLGAGLLWDRSLKGKLGSWTDWRTNIWYAALKTEQDPNNIKDLEAVWGALREQRNLIKKYWASGAEQMSLLANEEVYASIVWSGRVKTLQNQGHKHLKLLIPDGAFSWQECIFVMKGTDLKIAHKLLNYMLEPDCAFEVARGQSYPSSLDPTKVDTPADVASLPGFDETGTLNGYLFADPGYWNSKQVEWAEKWDRIMAGR
ncbi:MAG: extracellular solute-binding protein [Deltaproteobacteria bacterium]|jgi:spermidine/putrescine transport system substrate-binding protein|nr:extracellular solute-binding protein [Deltaproteobacteria bacterium]MBT4638286.1 extracellular solute-binding protein [Deltaproteobacteria bacterium]MBT6504523.1 extracellular solute-binding protein [Deltaproteobacteria bacterium]MBT7153210.1 extracellular solute-binding protein [Deltaproteobacteria bacterium]MBT7714613.1 extracellular solute-binding protein [Deltaproteobacteria bacterium]